MLKSNPRFSLVTLLVGAMLVAASASFAGPVYVPLAGAKTVGGETYQTKVWVSNLSGDATNDVQFYFIASNTDGTDRGETEPTTISLGPAQTKMIELSGAPGMLELTAENEQDFAVDARMLAASQGSDRSKGTMVQVISSVNALAADTTGHLLANERKNSGDSSMIGFGVVNLGTTGTSCSADVFEAGGGLIQGDIQLVFGSPLSHFHFDDALAGLNASNVVDWRIDLTCDRQFFFYSTLMYPEAGRFNFVGPAKTLGGSDLVDGSGGVSDQFVYISDLPLAAKGGIRLGPYNDRSGVNFHPSGGGPPVGGFAPIRINSTTYEKGISWYPHWNQTPFVEYDLNGQYGLFTAVVRLDESLRGRYEWAIVSNSTWQRLERPSDGFNGVERSNPIRVAGAARFRIIGDGNILYDSPEIYAYGAPVVVEIDVTGVNRLRLQQIVDGTEQLNAPHRRGLSSPRLVRKCPWNDLINFADAKLFELN